MHFGCTEVTRANFSVRTAQPSAALIQNVIRESAESAAPSLCETSANSLKLSARNVGPVTLIPENSAESRDAFNGIEKTIADILGHKLLPGSAALSVGQSYKELLRQMSRYFDILVRNGSESRLAKC
jgi:hypothetical protein